VDWFEEMAKKTVARRHSKVLPMNTDLDNVLQRDNVVFGVPDSAEDGEPPKAAVKVLRGLKGKLAVLAGAAAASAGKAAQGPSEGQREAISKKSEPEAKREEERREDRDDTPGDVEEIIDSDGVIEDIEEEPQREQVDPIATAQERGAAARRDGFQRKAVPPEYRREDRAAEAEAWTSGWVGEHKRLQGAKPGSQSAP
jgi:recombination protein RecT